MWIFLNLSDTSLGFLSESMKYRKSMSGICSYDSNFLSARNCLEICDLLCEAGIEHFGIFCTSEVCEVT